MSTFISIISIQTNSLTSDSLTVALLAVTGNKVIFQYYEDKISLAEKMASAK